MIEGISLDIFDRYDAVEEIIGDYPDLKLYTIHDVMNTENVLFVCGCRSIVKNQLGLLRIQHNDNTQNDVYMTRSYLNADYIKIL